jgi:hypothetical protein
VKTGRILRVVAIVLLGLTAVMTLLGGAGTTCAAFNAEGFESMVDLIPYQWLYQILVVTTIAASAVGFWAIHALLRGKRKAYPGALGFLVAGLVLGGIQMIASYSLRGKTAPTNVRVYLTAFTLLLFFLFKLPGIRDKINLSDNRGDPITPAGLTLFLGGVLTLTTSMWAGPTHMLHGANLVHVLQGPLTIAGSAMTLGGIALLVRPASIPRPALADKSLPR